jgi:phage shock protein PspC (stress-responsive transcriptional regulator)
MDVTLMRILWIIAALFTGIGFIAYVVAWIAMPRDYEPLASAVPQRT